MPHDPPALRAQGAPPTPAVRRDRWLLLAPLLLLAFTMGAFDVYSPDAPFHLAVGRFIRQHGRFPTAADLLWTQEAKPWADSEWLFQVVVYGIHQAAGVAGLVVFRCMILAAIAGVLWYLCRGHIPAIVACGIVAALFAAQRTFGLRPGLATLLFLALYWLILEHGGKRALLIGLPALGLVWANTHGFWPVGAGLALLCAAGQLRTNAHRAKRIAAAAILCIAVAVANPNGIDGFFFPFRAIGYLRGMKQPVMANIVELRPLWSFEGMALSEVRETLAAAAVVGLVLIAIWPRRRGGDALILAFAFALALPARRNMGIASVIAAPVFVRGLSLSVAHWSRGLGERRPRAVAAARVAFAVLFAGFCLFAAGERVCGRAYARRGIIQRAGFGWARAVFPIGPMRFIHARHVQGPLFNAFETGGYIAWTGAPKRRPFINAHTDLYSPAFYRDYVAIHSAGPACMEKLDAYRVQCVVATHLRTMALPMRLVKAKWALVQADGTGAVFVRPGGPNAAVAERFGLEPSEWTWEDAEPLPDESPHYASPLLRVLNMLGLPNRVVRPVMRFQRGRFMLAMGNARVARRDLEAVVRMAPDWAEPHVALGRAYEQLGLHANALDAYERAAALAPRNTPAQVSLGWLLCRLGQHDKAIGRLEAALRGCQPGYVRCKVRGLLYAAREDYLAARREFEQALRRRPGDAQATRLMQWVDQLRAERKNPNTPSRPPIAR